MLTIFHKFLGLIFLIALMLILWRYASKRIHLPCPSWLGWMVELDNPFAQTHKASFIIEQLQLKPGMNVLDAGCGPGRLTIPLAEKLSGQGTVTAMDIQEAMLQKVRIKAQTKNLNNIDYLNAGLGYGKLTSNTYDRALLITVLGEIPDQKAALAEIFNSLKPGGILAISELIFDPHFQSRSTVTKLTKEVGFQEKSFSGNRFAFTMLFEKPFSK